MVLPPIIKAALNLWKDYRDGCSWYIIVNNIMNEYYYARSDRAAKEKEYRTKLKQLADENNVLAFYKLYAEYLEWNSIISPSRKAIHKMANKVIELMENK